MVKIYRRRAVYTTGRKHLPTPDLAGSPKRGKRIDYLIIKKNIFFLSALLFVYSFLALKIWEKIVAIAPIVAVITPMIAAITPGFSRGACGFVGSAVTGT
jgi:hypothetical protein